VTVAQFRSFAEDYPHNDGFRPVEPRCLDGLLNHPITLVSWYEAMLYCRWLTGRLMVWSHTPPLLRTVIQQQAWCICLPSEAELEKAARGVDARVFPWGNRFEPELANGLVTEIGTTSAVGCFRIGAGPYLLDDLVGDVCVWTRSAWVKYPYTPDYDGVSRESLQARDDVVRVVRGGSFEHEPGSLESTYRTSNHPTFRLRDLGFRLVVSPFRVARSAGL
jgi:formylglycine-generating enzyme required for sulfatase activity